MSNVDDSIRETILDMVNKVSCVINSIENDLNENLKSVKSMFDITREEFVETSKNKNHPKYKVRTELMQYINKNCNRYYTSSGIYKYYNSEKEVSDIIKDINVNIFKKICKKENINF